MTLIPKTLFGRLFLLILAFMLCVIILVRLLFFFVVGYPASQQLSNFSHSMMIFAEEVNHLGTADSNQQFAEKLQKSTGMILLPNASTAFGTTMNIPFYQRWKDSLALASNNKITMSYQNEPQSVIWLHHVASSLFSLGLPSVDYINIMHKFVIISVIVTISFTWFSAYVAAYFLNRPLGELVEKARLIGQEIDSIAIEPSGPKEIRDVSVAMNKMHTDIENMIKKQQFLLSGISHDLRTPLTRLHIAIQILAPDAHGFKDGMNEDIEEMNGVLHRFIELARYNVEEVELWQVGDIGVLIKDVISKYQRAETKIILSLTPTPQVRYKPLSLQRYLYNLINNSIKHGGGTITISTHVMGNLIALSVADEGPGFPLSAEALSRYSDLESDQQLVLDQSLMVNGQHSDTDHPLNKDQPSLNGLGLRIVQLIAKMHEADLTLRNKPDGGAEVILTLKAFSKEA